VRLSPARLVLRSALLLVGGGFMLWRAWEARAAARLLPGPERVLGDRIALVEALVGVLAAGTGILALLPLRRRQRRHSLHLPPGGRPRPPDGGGPAGGAPPG
jgi:hypothetical protein